MSEKAVFYVNGNPFPPPQRGFTLLVSTNVDSSRNSQGEVVGQKVGRDIYKLDSVEWPYLSAEKWSEMLQEFSDFFVSCTFWDMVNNKWITHKCYPGDRTAKPYWLNDNDEPIYYTECKVNLIDCGVVDE